MMPVPLLISWFVYFKYDRRRLAAAVQRAWLFFLRHVLLLLPLAACISAHGQKLITPGYLFNSDPTCREINGQFYLFTTHDPFTVRFVTDNTGFKSMLDYHAFSTTDFDHWVDHGSILNTQDAKWHAGTAMWDGDAGIPANGRFYAYAPFRMNPDSEDNSGLWKMGVFVSDRVDGAYRDVLGRPLTTADGKDLVGLSPTVVYSDAGKPYLLWGSGDPDGNGVYMAKLMPNMTELAGPVREITVEIRNSCGGLEYFESPILFSRKGLWYLTYVAFNDDKLTGGHNCNFSASDPPGSYIRYAISKSMFGPFDKNLRTVIYPGAGGVENVQQGVCQYKGDWYIAYHIGRDGTHHRQATVTRLKFLPDGSLAPIYPDRDQGVGTLGVSQLTLDAFAPKREAAEFHERSGADAEREVMGEYHFKMTDGGYLRFNRVDFGGGAARLRAAVSSENRALTKARLEIRIDGLKGTLIGQASIDYTGGKTDYSIVTGKVAQAVRGLHDVFLVAHGSGCDRDGHLFNLAWFTFTRPGSGEGR
jgi:hypothetical protein